MLGEKISCITNKIGCIELNAQSIWDIVRQDLTIYSTFHPRHSRSGRIYSEFFL